MLWIRVVDSEAVIVTWKPCNYIHIDSQSRTVSIWVRGSALIKFKTWLLHFFNMPNMLFVHVDHAVIMQAQNDVLRPESDQYWFLGADADTDIRE